MYIHMCIYIYIYVYMYIYIYIHISRPRPAASGYPPPRSKGAVPLRPGAAGVFIVNNTPNSDHDHNANCDIAQYSCSC